MARKKPTSKQVAWSQLQKRIQKREAQGYTQVKDIDYKKLTEKQIRELTRNKLDPYFEYIDTETGETFTPSEYRKQPKKELGMSVPLTQTMGDYGVIDRVRQSLWEMENYVGVWDNHKPLFIPTNKIQLVALFEQRLNMYGDEGYIEYLQTVEDKLSDDLIPVIYKASTQEDIESRLNDVFNILAWKVPLSQEEQMEINDIAEGLMG